MVSLGWQVTWSFWNYSHFANSSVRFVLKEQTVAVIYDTSTFIINNGVFGYGVHIFEQGEVK